MSSNTLSNPVDASSRLRVVKQVITAWIVAFIILVDILGMPAWAYILLSIVFAIQYHPEENHPLVNSRTDMSLATFAPHTFEVIDPIRAPATADQNTGSKSIQQQEDPSINIASFDIKTILEKDQIPSNSAAMPHRIQVTGDSLSCRATHKEEKHRSLVPVNSAFIQQSRVIPESQNGHPSTVSCYGVNTPSSGSDNLPMPCNEKLAPLAVVRIRSQAKPLRALSKQSSTRTLSHPGPILFAHPRTLSSILSHVTTAPYAMARASLTSDNIPILVRILPSIRFPKPAFGPLPVSQTHILPIYTPSDLSNRIWIVYTKATFPYIQSLRLLPASTSLFFLRPHFLPGIYEAYSHLTSQNSRSMIRIDSPPMKVKSNPESATHRQQEQIQLLPTGPTSTAIAALPSSTASDESDLSSNSSFSSVAFFDNLSSYRKSPTGSDQASESLPSLSSSGESSPTQPGTPLFHYDPDEVLPELSNKSRELSHEELEYICNSFADWHLSPKSSTPPPQTSATFEISPPETKSGSGDERVEELQAKPAAGLPLNSSGDMDHHPEKACLSTIVTSSPTAATTTPEDPSDPQTTSIYSASNNVYDSVNVPVSGKAQATTSSPLPKVKESRVERVNGSAQAVPEKQIAPRKPKGLRGRAVPTSCKASKTIHSTKSVDDSRLIEYPKTTKVPSTATSVTRVHGDAHKSPVSVTASNTAAPTQPLPKTPAVERSAHKTSKGPRPSHFAKKTTNTPPAKAKQVTSSSALNAAHIPLVDPISSCGNTSEAVRAKLSIDVALHASSAPSRPSPAPEPKFASILEIERRISKLTPDQIVEWICQTVDITKDISIDDAEYRVAGLRSGEIADWLVQNAKITEGDLKQVSRVFPPTVPADADADMVEVPLSWSGPATLGSSARPTVNPSPPSGSPLIQPIQPRNDDTEMAEAIPPNPHLAFAPFTPGCGVSAYFVDTGFTTSSSTVNCSAAPTSGSVDELMPEAYVNTTQVAATAWSSPAVQITDMDVEEVPLAIEQPDVEMHIPVARSARVNPSNQPRGLRPLPRRDVGTVHSVGPSAPIVIDPIPQVNAGQAGWSRFNCLVDVAMAEHDTLGQGNIDMAQTAPAVLFGSGLGYSPDQQLPQLSNGTPPSQANMGSWVGQMDVDSSSSAPALSHLASAETHSHGVYSNHSQWTAGACSRSFVPGQPTSGPIAQPKAVPALPFAKKEPSKRAPVPVAARPKKGLPKSQLCNAIAIDEQSPRAPEMHTTSNAHVPFVPVTAGFNATSQAGTTLHRAQHGTIEGRIRTR